MSLHESGIFKKATVGTPCSHGPHNITETMRTLVDDVVALVRDYVALVDGANAGSAYVFLRSCAGVLPRIYATGLDLPNVSPTDDATEPVIESPLRRLAGLLGRYDTYSEVFDPYIDEPPVFASLADDLADVYLELARPLRLFEGGRVADATWDWAFGIRGHCGDHLVDALRAIHRA